MDEGGWMRVQRVPLSSKQGHGLKRKFASRAHGLLVLMRMRQMLRFTGNEANGFDLKPHHHHQAWLRVLQATKTKTSPPRLLGQSWRGSEKSPIFGFKQNE